MSLFGRDSELFVTSAPLALGWVLPSSCPDPHRKVAVPGQHFGETEWDSAGRLGTTAHNYVCTHATHSDGSQCAVSDIIFTYSALKVFSYVPKLTLRELFVIM